MVGKNRSLGIITIGIVEIIIGTYGVFTALNIIIAFSKPVVLSPHWANEFRGAIPMAVIGLICYLLLVFLGIALFQKKPFARKLHIIFSLIIAISIVNLLWIYIAQVIVYLRISVLANMNELILMAITLAIIIFGYTYYFTRPKIKEQFK